MPPPFNPIEEEIGRSVAADMAHGPMVSAQYADPARTARANEVARRLGLPPPVVEADMDRLTAEDRLRGAVMRARDNPTYARMMSNPRITPVAMNDEGFFPLAQALHQTIQTAQQLRSTTALTPPAAPAHTFNPLVQWGRRAGAGVAFLGNVLRAAGSGAGVGLAGLARGTIEQLEPLNPQEQARRILGGRGPSTYQAGSDFFDRIARYYERAQREAQTDFGNRWINAAVRGVENVPQQVVALLAASRGNPEAAIGILSGLQGGQSYQQGREQGLDPHQALTYASTQAGLEAVGEMIPILRYMDDAVRGSGFIKTLGMQILTENAGEQLTGHLQDFNQWATLEANHGKTFQDYLNERPGAALEIAIATTAGVGLQTSLARGVQRVMERSLENAESRVAASNVDRVMAAAAQSTTSSTNPSDFEDALAAQLDGVPGEHLYVPAEAIRTLHQDAQDLAADPFWGAYADQITEAEALGGDVVIPLAAAATHLAGTPQWEAIKNQVRGSPGGSSRAEMKEAEEAFADAAQRTGEEFAALMEEQRAAMEPVQRVYEAMRDKLLVAGFTPDAASQMAAQFAQRQRVRAERLGGVLTGEEAGAVDVRTGETPPEGRTLDQAPIEGALPTNGVAPANIGKDGRIYVGRQGEGHFQVMERYPDVEWGGGTGFINPEGHFLNRAEALEWVNSHGERIRPSENMRAGGAQQKDELDALDYRDQSKAIPRRFFQSYMEGPRGRVTFTAEGRSVIDLFASRDLSTAIHEFGHIYLEEMKTDAEIALQLDTDQARQLFADWEAVKAWFKREGHEIGEDGVIPTEAHELWARGFERFTMEGKAPSSALRRAFEAFRTWMLTIYKVVDNLRSPITPEIRDVMARLLATDEEIAAAAEEQEIRALFKTAEEAGMTEAEFAAYRSATEEARGEAYDALLYRTMASIRAQRTKEYREREAAVRSEAMAEVDNQPLFKALRLLRNGRIADEEPRTVRIGKQWLIDTYGEDALDLVPRSVPPIYGDKNLMDPDAIADEAGFASGDEMVRTLMGLESVRQEMKARGDKRSPRQAQIDEMTAARMAERYGDPLRDGSIEEEARALIHNDQQGEVIASELRSLARRAGKKPTPYAIARRWAADKIAAGEVREVASGAALQQYQRAARKAGKAAEAAMLKGDVDETFRQKQAQMLNNALIAEGKKAKDRTDVAVRRLSRIARRKTSAMIAQDYLDQAHQLLEQVDLKARTRRDVERLASFTEWANEQMANGHDVAVPDNFAERLGTTHWSKLSVEQLIGLDDTVKQIMHLGRLKQTLLDGQERRAREEVIAEMQAAGAGLKQRPPTTLNDPDRSRWQALKSKLRGADAAMIKIEQLVDWLDGGNPNGVFNRMIFKPLAEAQGREADLMRDYVAKMNEAVGKVPRKQLRDWRRRVETPELINRIPGHPLNGEAWSFYKDQIVMMAMNMGNEGNRQRLMDGYGWSERQVQDVLDRLMTAEDWQFVQTVWDTIDGLWPDVEALEKRVNGIAPAKVEAIPVDTPFGTFRGGYFPAIYDQQWSSRAEKDQESDLLEKGYTRANVRASATKERADRVKRPILLSMEVITRHLAEVIHDVTHREALTEAWRVVSDDRVQTIITNVLGREYSQLLRPWLKHIANDQARNANSNGTVVSVARRLRSNVTIVGLGYRISSTIAQIAGMPNIIAQIGERRMLEGWGRYLRNPLAAYREVTEKSAEMRDRFSTVDRDIVERARQMSKAKGVRAITGPSWVTRYAYHGILVMDSILTTAGWMGAYRKATAEGMTEDEAIYYADKVVRKSQGAGGAKDQAAIQRDHELVKWFTMFFSYWSALYNQQRDLGHRLRRVSGFRDAGKVAHYGFWAVVMPPIMNALIMGELPANGGDDDDDETLLGWMAKRIFFGNISSIPLIRELGNAVDHGFGYRMTPIQNIGEGLDRGWENLKRVFDEDPATHASSHWMKQTLSMLGLVFGLPTGQAATSAQFVYDVEHGEQHPEGAVDWYQGLTTGRTEAQH